MSAREQESVVSLSPFPVLISVGITSKGGSGAVRTTDISMYTGVFIKHL